MQGILNRAPWNMGTHLFLLIEGFEYWIPDSKAFHFIDVRVQVWGLPNFIVIKQVGKNLMWMEGPKSIHIQEQIFWGYKLYRLKLRINVLQPLHEYILLCLDDHIEFLEILCYERLVIFCYHSGRLGHAFVACTYPPALIVEDDIPYDEWIATSSNVSKLIWNFSAAQYNNHNLEMELLPPNDLELRDNIEH